QARRVGEVGREHQQRLHDGVHALVRVDVVGGTRVEVGRLGDRAHDQRGLGGGQAEGEAEREGGEQLTDAGHALPPRGRNGGTRADVEGTAGAEAGGI